MDRRLFIGSAAAAAFTPTIARAQAGFALTLSDVGLLMPVTVKGRTMKAIFDCGASQCILDSKLAQAMGIAVVKTFRAEAAYDGFKAGRSDPVDLLIGDRAFRQTLMITPLGEIGEDVGMLIGRDVLAEACLDLDVPNRRASFQATRPAPGLSPIRMIQGLHGDPVVQVEVEGLTANASLDSGNTQPLMIRKDWWDRASGLRDHVLTPWVGDDLSGQASITMTDLKRFGFGGVDLHDVPAEVSQTQLSYEVNLGLPVLQRFHSFWDLKTETLWLSPSTAELSKPFEHERAGLACARVGDVLKVVYVVPDSKAAQVGFKAEDEITAIDGKSVSAMSEDASLAWKHDPARTSVLLTVGSGEIRHLDLHDYF